MTIFIKNNIGDTRSTSMMLFKRVCLSLPMNRLHTLFSCYFLSNVSRELGAEKQISNIMTGSSVHFFLKSVTQKIYTIHDGDLN